MAKKRIKVIRPADPMLLSLDLENNTNIGGAMYNTKHNTLCNMFHGVWGEHGKDYANKGVTRVNKNFKKYVTVRLKRLEKVDSNELFSGNSFIVSRQPSKKSKYGLFVLETFGHDDECSFKIVFTKKSLLKFFEFANYTTGNNIHDFIKDYDISSKLGTILNSPKAEKYVVKHENVPDIEEKYKDISDRLLEKTIGSFITFHEKGSCISLVDHKSDTLMLTSHKGEDSYNDLMFKGRLIKWKHLIEIGFKDKDKVLKHFLVHEDEIIEYMIVLSQGINEEYIEYVSSKAKIVTDDPTNTVPFISLTSILNEEMIEEEVRYLNALKYGYKSTQELLMYWFFLDQPYHPDREVWADDHRREVNERTRGSDVDAAKRRIKRIPSDRALQGRLNVEIVYRSGKRYPGRMRATREDYAIIEPAKGDTKAWMCDLSEVRDLRIINLAVIPNIPIIHTPKNIAWMKSLPYINKYDF